MLRGRAFAQPESRTRGCSHDRMIAFQQFSRVQLVHDGLFQSDLQIELINLVCPREAI